MSFNLLLECFADRTNPISVINRLSAEWAAYHGVEPIPINRHSRITIDTWGYRECVDHLYSMSELQPAIITDSPPRRTGGYIVIVDYGSGRLGQIDGRRRLNQILRNGCETEQRVMRIWHGY